MVSTATRTDFAPAADLAVILSDSSECTILTPDESAVANGLCAPRSAEHLEEAYSIQLSQVSPKGVLEALIYADRPQLMIRLENGGEVAVRLDHVTGPPERRQYFCHLQA